MQLAGVHHGLQAARSQQRLHAAPAGVRQSRGARGLGVQQRLHARPGGGDRWRQRVGGATRTGDPVQKDQVHVARAQRRQQGVAGALHRGCGAAGKGATRREQWDGGRVPARPTISAPASQGAPGSTATIKTLSRATVASLARSAAPTAASQPGSTSKQPARSASLRRGCASAHSTRTRNARLCLRRGAGAHSTPAASEAATPSSGRRTPLPRSTLRGSLAASNSGAGVATGAVPGVLQPLGAGPSQTPVAARGGGAAAITKVLVATVGPNSGCEPSLAIAAAMRSWKLQRQAGRGERVAAVSSAALSYEASDFARAALLGRV